MVGLSASTGWSSLPAFPGQPLVPLWVSMETCSAGPGSSGLLLVSSSTYDIKVTCAITMALDEATTQFHSF